MERETDYINTADSIRSNDEERAVSEYENILELEEKMHINKCCCKLS